MNDFVFTSKLICNQKKKKNISDAFKISMEEKLRPLSNKIDGVIERVYEFIKIPPKKINQVLALKKINDEYQALRKTWNMYIKKMFLVLKKIGRGDRLLENEAQKFYSEMYL